MAKRKRNESFGEALVSSMIAGAAEYFFDHNPEIARIARAIARPPRRDPRDAEVVDRTPLTPQDFTEMIAEVEHGKNPELLEKLRAHRRKLKDKLDDQLAREKPIELVKGKDGVYREERP